MKNKKSKLQKVSLFFAVISIISSVACVIYLYFNIGTLGWESPVSASLLASSFFFAFICFIFVVMGTSNLPSFKIGDD